MPTWTNEQLQAIERKNSNILVAAAAGSGKTAVLTERIKKMVIYDNINIDEILVVTFTKLAALEMKERISKSLYDAMEKEEFMNRAKEQLIILNKSSITTMHSFCLEIIKSNFYAIDIDPNFRIGDEMEILLMKDEALEEVFENEFENDNDGNFKTILDYFSRKKNEDPLKEIVIKLYNFSISSPNPEKWLKDAANLYNIDDNFIFEETIHGKILIEYVNDILLQCNKQLNNLKDKMDNYGIPAYVENIIIDLELINEIKDIFNNREYDLLYTKLYGIKFARMKSVKNIDEDIKKIMKDGRESVKSYITNLGKTVFNDKMENRFQDIKDIYPVIKSLSNLVIKFKDHFEEMKREKNIIDFNDIEHFALKLLKDEDDMPSEIAKSYRKKFKEVLVDEYQDTNNVQEEIVKLLSKEENPNMFMVGDIKQSIYKFRQARPEIFLDKYNKYSPNEIGLDQKILLYKNFRSSKTIIESVNKVFKSIMSKEIGELDYDEKEELIYGANYINSTNKVEVHIFDKEDSKKEDTEDIESNDEFSNMVDEENLKSSEVEARIVAERINDLMSSDFKIYDKELNVLRNIKYSDIVILMRATSKSCDIYKTELTNQDIPVYEDSNRGYFDTIEIRTIISLLQVIDNPYQDIPLLAVLLSPIFEITEDEISEIRIYSSEKNIYESIKDYYNDDFKDKCEKIKEKLRYFFFNLSKWREKVLYMSIDEFIWSIYFDTNYYAFVITMPGGAQRQANLKLLFEKAKEYENTSYKGLFNFVNYINKIKKSDGDFGAAKILGENADVVRIMSIHKSKGLEFPIVFLCQSGKQFNMMDFRETTLLHQDMGIGVNYVDINRNLTYGTLYKDAIKLKMFREILSEEMRILYVAITRPKEKLIITGSLRNVEKKLELYKSGTDEKLDLFQVEKGKSYLDWIMMSILDENSDEHIKLLESYKTVTKGIWEMKLWTINMLKEKESTITEVNEEIEINIEENLYEKIDEKLKWKYKYEKLDLIPTKLSVSELKKIIPDDKAKPLYNEDIVLKPNFLESKVMTASEKGVIMHRIMERLKFKENMEMEDIKIQIEEMAIKEIITKEERESVSINKVYKLIKSNIGKEIINAYLNDNLKREEDFYLEINADEVYKDLKDGSGNYDNEKIQIQGVIDAYIINKDKITLIDYKTDYIENGKENEFVDKYIIQMKYYSQALEKITGKKVNRCVLYSFSRGKEFEIIKD